MLPTQISWKHAVLTVLLTGVVLLLATPVSAQQDQDTMFQDTGATFSVDAGVTPGSPLYGLEVALDRVRLALTFNNEKKAELALRIAEERLAEVQSMIQANNTEGLSTAQEQYAAAATTARASMQKARGSAQFNAEARKQFTQQQAAFQNLEADLEAGAAPSQAQREVREIDAEMDRMRTAVQSHRNKTVQELREEGRSDEEIRTEFRAAADATGLTAFHRDTAQSRLNKATTCLQNTQNREVSTEREPQFRHMVNVSKRHRDAARAAFDAERYGEAFGRATASWKICRAAAMWADGASREEVKEVFEDAHEDMEGEFSVSISVSCSGGLNESASINVEVEIEENGVEEEVMFTLTGQCPPDRSRIVSEIADRTSLTAEEVRTYMGPGMEARAEFEFDAEDAREEFERRREEIRERFEEQRDEFEERFRNRTAGFEQRFECVSDPGNSVEVNAGDEPGEIEVSARTPLNHGGYMAAADVDVDEGNRAATVTVTWIDSGQAAIQCIGEGRADQELVVSQTGEWTVTVRILVDGEEQYSQTRTVSVQ